MVVVFGSINLDLVARAERFPRPGETLAAESFAMYPGGKGANQALAAARAGAAVAMVGAVGDDAFAGPALSALAAGGVDLTHVRRVSAPTGIAVIAVAASGENTILVAPGANAHVDANAVPDDWLRAPAVLVLQHEVPAAANAAIVARAAGTRTRILLNGAPARSIATALLSSIDVLVVNETEMREVAHEHDLPADPEAFVEAYARRHGRAAIVTLGAAGIVAADPAARHALPAPAIEVVDTTAAGDAFVGALAAGLAQDLSLRMALTRAVAAGSLACTRAGAQPSLPEAAAIETLAATLAPRVVVTPIE
jgi:ribokinase